MDELPLLQRLARDINRNTARFIAVEDGTLARYRVSPTIFIASLAQPVCGRSHWRMLLKRCVNGSPNAWTPSSNRTNRALAEYYAQEFGWNCDDPNP